MGPSAHFSWDETKVSDTAARKGINNQWPEAYRDRVIFTASQMEKVRDILGGKPITVNSWYRCPDLNRAIGGASASSHMDGWAVDFTCSAFGTPLQVANKLAASGLKFDQLIHECGVWIHIGFDPKMRQQLMTYYSGGPYKFGLMTHEQYLKA